MIAAQHTAYAERDNEPRPQQRPGHQRPARTEMDSRNRGLAGPQQRCTLAIMNSLNGEGGYDDGVETTTRLAQILLGPA